MIIFVVLCLAAMQGCAGGRAHSARGEYWGRRTTGAVVLENLIKQYREDTKSLKALASFVFGDSEEERRTDAAIVVVRPDRVRVDAIDPLADVWAKAGSDGKTMWLYLPSKLRLYSGRASAGNLRRLTKFDFELSELLDVITGTPPVSADAPLLQAAGDRDHFVVEGKNLHIWTHGRERRIVKLVRFGDNGRDVDYTVEFGDFRRLGAIEFPYKIEARIPKRGARIVVVYKDLSLSDVTDPSLFLAPKPPRARVHRLDGK